MANPDHLMPEKVCKRCGQHKPLVEFSKDKRATDGRFYICKLCDHLDYLKRRKPPTRCKSPALPPDATKVCSRCRRELSVRQFNRSKGAKNGLNPRCKDCLHALRKVYRERYAETIRQAKRRFYQAHREELIAKTRAWQQGIRLAVLQHYSGGQPACACCGERQIEFLVIDHVNGGGNQHRRELKRQSCGFHKWLQDNGYPDGFQVLCHNCNMAKGFNGTCPHQAGE